MTEKVEIRGASRWADEGEQREDKKIHPDKGLNGLGGKGAVDESLALRRLMVPSLRSAGPY